MQKEVQWLLEEKYKGKATPNFKKDVKRLEAGEPLDYLIGFMEFLGCKIDLSKKPLIPRFETEYWTEQVIEDLRLKIQDLRILDMFAGSGAIGISIVRHIKRAAVVLADSEKNCVEQMKINCRLNKIPKNRYQVVQSDLFKNVEGNFDIIVANPPYIPTVRKNKIQVSVIKHEPKAALFGGSDGLKFVGRFLAAAKKRLNEGGKIYMEFDSPQKPAIAKLIKKYGYSDFQFRKDQYNRWRYVEISR